MSNFPYTSPADRPTVVPSKMAGGTMSLPNYTDIAIVGAGPQALTLVTHLLQKRAKYRGNFLVFDASGSWLSQWRHQFAAQEIPHLRSPAVHHPAPNPHALRAFAENRPEELFPPYGLPGTKLFEDFCWDLIRCYGLEDCVYPARVQEILALKPRFRLILEGGGSIVARRVVLATGGGTPQFPDWVKKISTPYPPDRLLHSQQVDLRPLGLEGEQILIVGGGLSSGHLAVGAIARGAKVLLMARREFQEKLFDADAGWLGPKYLKGFFSEPDWQKRWEMIQQARNGGSLTPAMMLQLRRAAHEGKLALRERCQVKEAIWQGHQWQIVCGNGEKYECDRLWLATGTGLQGRDHPLLSGLLEAFPVQFVKGLPILDGRLRLPGTELFVMGGLAGLQLGPTARNLAGGIRAGRCIVEALVKPSLAVG